MGSIHRSILPTFACGLTLACSTTRTGTPESLGYGPERELGHGYVEQGSPFERPAPTAWLIANQPKVGTPDPFGAAAPPRIDVPGDLHLICLHAVDVLATTSSDAFDRAAALDVCHVLGRTERLARTSDSWSGYFACMVAGKSLDEFEACERSFPSYFATKLQRPETRELEVCQHIIVTTIIEETADETIRQPADLDPFVPIVDECITRLVGEEKAERTPEAYELLLDCVLTQSSSVAMEACE